MVRLQPMNETEYQEYLAVSIADYAQEHVKAGRWNAEEALQKATQEYADILTEGLHTRNQYLFTIVDEQTGNESRDALVCSNRKSKRAGSIRV